MVGEGASEAKVEVKFCSCCRILDISALVRSSAVLAYVCTNKRHFRICVARRSVGVGAAEDLSGNEGSAFRGCCMEQRSE